MGNPRLVLDELWPTRLTRQPGGQSTKSGVELQLSIAL